MIPDVYKPFIQAVIDKTNNDEAKWEAMREKSYVLRTKNSTIEIGFFTDEDAELSYYYFKFFNFVSKAEAYFKVSNSDHDFRLMDQLYTVASASAANIKDELSSFLDEL